VERGLVERTADPADRRQVILSLTRDAITLLKDIRRKRDAWMSVRVGHLTAEEQDILRQASTILTRVANE
jgi:DNA-binding MarR family transcriptional regulator